MRQHLDVERQEEEHLPDVGGQVLWPKAPWGPVKGQEEPQGPTDEEERKALLAAAPHPASRKSSCGRRQVLPEEAAQEPWQDGPQEAEEERSEAESARWPCWPARWNPSSREAQGSWEPERSAHGQCDRSHQQA